MEPVVAILDVGKTNKKLFLFDQSYKIVYERSVRFFETEDEDGFPCESLESLRQSVFDSLKDVQAKEYDVRAVNFTTYGASLVYLDRKGEPLTPLYNYLKPYPEDLKRQFYDTYGGEEKVAAETASPVLGSLNSGLQLYRIKHERPDLYKKIRYALHLPQYLSFLLTGKPVADITSIGCHTALWDFRKSRYHHWVTKERLELKLAPVVSSSQVFPAADSGNRFVVGTGLHDSSAALIPYLVNFHDPFVLISTGTWCISLNPFKHQPLTAHELHQDCLCFLNYQGTGVRASRLFAGYEHEAQVKKIADHFNADPVLFRNMAFSGEVAAALKARNRKEPDIRAMDNPGESGFIRRDWTGYHSATEAYHQLIMDLVDYQYTSTQLVISGTAVKRIFVDGGFSRNAIFMNLLAAAFPHMEVFAASMAQATAVGAALAIHDAWSDGPVPNDIIELKYYSVIQDSLA